LTPSPPPGRVLIMFAIFRSIFPLVTPDSPGTLTNKWGPKPKPENFFAGVLAHYLMKSSLHKVAAWLEERKVIFYLPTFLNKCHKGLPVFVFNSNLCLYFLTLFFYFLRQNKSFDLTWILEAVITSLMGLLAWLPIENWTAFPVLLSLLWHFRCWLQYHIISHFHKSAQFLIACY